MPDSRSPSQPAKAPAQCQPEACHCTCNTISDMVKSRIIRRHRILPVYCAVQVDDELGFAYHQKSFESILTGLAPVRNQFRKWFVEAPGCKTLDKMIPSRLCVQLR
jgi:hypothetical protein